MEVEGISLPSIDTEKGVRVHKRVDKPSSLSDNEDDSEHMKVVRSLVLSSDELGLTATLDLAEITGNVAVPVEYRKGKPKHVIDKDIVDSELPEKCKKSVEPWPIDLIQVGLQAILLRKAGYTVEEAIIYYSEEKRRIRLSIDDDVIINSLEILEKAKECAKAARPAPLLNDPKCIKCSLQPICLPDEINQQLNSNENNIRPRKIWPPRDDGIHVVAQTEGAKIGVRGKELRFVDKDGVAVKTMPLTNLESLSLLGSVQISTQAIRVLADLSIPVAFLSPAGRLVAMLDPLDSISAEIRKSQVRRFDNEKTCLELARALVSAKIINQRTLLLRNHKKMPDGLERELAKQSKKVLTADSIDAIRGHEGQAASLYFQHFSGMLRGASADEFGDNGRQRRPPPDPVNACLSLAYSMLTHECITALRLARLEPSIGGFHVSRPGRPALALDLMEPFRPLIADSIAITCFNRGELSEGHFYRTAGGCVFTDVGRKSFFKALGRRMDTEITHPVFKYRLSYRRMIVLHARMIAAWLTGDIPSLAFLTTR